MPMRIRFLRTPDGQSPVESFLDGLPPKDAQKVLWTFRLLERLERIPITYLRKLAGTAEIWEVRIQGTRQIYRVLGFHHRGTLWLTNGYSKKSRRTDRLQIARAERSRTDFITAQRN
jgi:phage-related protein